MEGGNKYILTWEYLVPGHLCIIIVTLCSSLADLFPSLSLRSSLCRCTRVRVLTSAATLARFYSTTKVSAIVRLELRHCLPVGKYYSNRHLRGVTIMFSFATNPRPTAPFRLLGEGFESAKKGTLVERMQRERVESLRLMISLCGQRSKMERSEMFRYFISFAIEKLRDTLCNDKRERVARKRMIVIATISDIFDKFLEKNRQTLFKVKCY